MKFLFGLICALLLGFYVLPARADCVSDCQASTYCDSTAGWECGPRLNNCYLQCQRNNDSSSSRSIAGAYGAIAYDDDSWAYGMADHSPDKDSARKSALKYCGRHGKNCKIVESFSDTCAAVAQNVKGTVAWYTDDNSRKAVEGALKRCNSKTDDHTCHITLKNCYSK